MQKINNAGCDEPMYGINFEYHEHHLLREIVLRNILDPKVCNDACLSHPHCIAWTLRSSHDNTCVPVTHYKNIGIKPGYVAGRRNTCIGI